MIRSDSHLESGLSLPIFDFPHVILLLSLGLLQQFLIHPVQRAFHVRKTKRIDLRRPAVRIRNITRRTVAELAQQMHPVRRFRQQTKDPCLVGSGHGYDPVGLLQHLPGQTPRGVVGDVRVVGRQSGPGKGRGFVFLLTKSFFINHPFRIIPKRLSFSPFKKSFIGILFLPSNLIFLR